MSHSEESAPGAEDLHHGLDAEHGLFHALGDGVVITDRAGRISFVNQRAADLFGYGAEELEGQPVELLLPDQQRQVHRAHRLRYVASPRVRPMGVGLTLWGRRADGAQFPLEISLSPWQSTDGQRYVAIVRDVSARYAAEAELRTVYNLLDRVREAVYLFDCDTLQIAYANEGAVDQTGYSRADLATMTPLHLLPDLDSDLLRAWLDALAPGGTMERVLTLRQASGAELPVECHIELPPLSPDQPPRYFAVFRDVSERLAREAEERMADRLGALIEDRERIARDLHDTAVQELFATGLALQGAAARAQGELRSRVERSVDNIDKAIRQVRAAIFSLSPHGRADSLSLAITEVIEESARALGFRPWYELDGPLDTVPSTEVGQHLLATLREALSNVARHASASRVEISVAVADGSLRLSVVDNGVGVGGEPTPAGSRGLANMAARADQSGGELTVSRLPGGGTSVSWTVPC